MKAKQSTMHLPSLLLLLLLVHGSQGQTISVDSECEVEIWFSDSLLTAIMGPDHVQCSSDKDPFLSGKCADIVETVSTASGSEHQPPGWSAAEHIQNVQALDGPAVASYNAAVGQLLFGQCVGGSACNALPVNPLASCFPAAGSSNQHCTANMLAQGQPYTDEKCASDCHFSLESYCERGLSPSGQQVSGCTFIPANSAEDQQEQIRREKAWCSSVCTAAEDACGAFSTRGPCTPDTETGYQFSSKAKCQPWGWWVIGVAILMTAFSVCAAVCWCKFKAKLQEHKRTMARQDNQPTISAVSVTSQSIEHMGGGLSPWAAAEANPVGVMGHPAGSPASAGAIPFQQGGTVGSVVLGKIVPQSQAPLDGAPPMPDERP